LKVAEAAQSRVPGGSVDFALVEPIDDAREAPPD
jgi:hypothetical protein